MSQESVRDHVQQQGGVDGGARHLQCPADMLRSSARRTTYGISLFDTVTVSWYKKDGYRQRNVRQFLQSALLASLGTTLGQSR